VNRGAVGPWVWISILVPAVIAAGIAFGVVADILSPAVWIDIVSVWPLAGIGFVAGPVVWLAGGRRVRHLAIPGLAVFTWLAMGLAFHVSGSDLGPVSLASVVGPARGGIGVAEIDVALGTGILEVGAGSDALYEIDPIRAGGTVGAPTAFEQSDADGVTIAAVPMPDPGLYVFRGWNVLLDESVSWTIHLAAERVSADLHGLASPDVHLDSVTSEVRLGAATTASTLELAGGSHRVYVEPGSAITLRGQGAVPSDWTIGADGSAAAPASGDGWTIRTSEGATVEVWYP